MLKFKWIVLKPVIFQIVVEFMMFPGSLACNLQEENLAISSKLTKKFKTVRFIYLCILRRKQGWQHT